MIKRCYVIKNNDNKVEQTVSNNEISKGIENNNVDIFDILNIKNSNSDSFLDIIFSFLLNNSYYLISFLFGFLLSYIIYPFIKYIYDFFKKKT